VADRVVVMNGGRIEQIGSPEEIYHHPANPFVIQFLGKVNLFHGRVHGGRARIGPVEVEMPEHAAVQDTPAVGYVRPHEIEIERTTPDRRAVRALISDIHPVGPVVRLELIRQDDGERIDVELARERYHEMKFEKGEEVFIRPRNLRIFLKGPES
jgi:sulfate transport system ATP-binding protein